ncbi:NAD(P)H-binding protein [Dyadobacter sandarakinus]|uniref:NAD(P)H-binding protein n=2 Tax=Dyadobacter sandarakinus TaxID=2747268 RepID=A0ABX7IDE8_9BACT|nr:NAD(P)H-binding protein [Dyadobacter sandarakinus]
MKNAIVFGASGFIGSFLLGELLSSPDYAQVTAVVRHALPISHPKLKTLIADYDTLPALKDQIMADEVFIALGTTRKNTPDQRKYYEVDHDYPVLAAKIAKERGARAVFIVTSVGANAGSSTFYIRTKGETERDIIALGMEQTHIFRPSMLMGSRMEKRTLEKLLINTFSIVNPLLFSKKLKVYKGIEGRDVARAMVAAARKPVVKIKVYHWQDMQDLLRLG